MDGQDSAAAWRMSVHIDEDGVRALVEWQHPRTRRWSPTQGFTGNVWAWGSAPYVLSAAMAALKATTAAECEYDHQDDDQPPWV